MSIPRFSPPDAGQADAPFLPLAFRLAAAFGLMALQVALPSEPGFAPRGEALYMASLAVLFGESVWEAARAIARGGQPFDTPSPGWIRFNLLLDAALVTLLIAFHGVDQERLATIYIFPVLASAFYLRNYEIVWVGILSSVLHITSALLFTSGTLGPFGNSREAAAMDPTRLAFILGFATLQIFAATLVVVVIRKHLEGLKKDLTQSEAAVDELSAMYRRVFESMLAGLITVDLQGAITSANPAAEKILNRPLPPGTPMPALGFGALEALGGSSGEQRFEVSLNPGFAGGEVRIVGGNRVPLRGTGGLVSGHLLVFQDLTEIKRLEERTRLSEKLATVGELSSEMAHELRNPMASILGCVQILKQSTFEPTPLNRTRTDRALAILDRESERVSTIVSDFLEFSRPRPVKIEALSLRELVENLQASWDTDLRCGGLPLQTGPVPDLWVLGDALRVHQVFTNLLSNARKALKDSQAPCLRLGFRHREGADSVAVTVSDNGCGMSESRQRSLFIPFASGFEEGSGLGMSLVYQFVQQMGWSIQVESALGTGTAVILTLPLKPGNLAPAGGTLNVT